MLYLVVSIFLMSALAVILRWAMAHRLMVAGLAMLVMASSVPLYKVVRQEYLPSNVDEGEFDVRVTAPDDEVLRLAEIEANESCSQQCEARPPENGLQVAFSRHFARPVTWVKGPAATA